MKDVMKYFLITLLFFTCLTFSSDAQQKKAQKADKKTGQTEQDNSFAPFSPAKSAIDANKQSTERKSKKTDKKLSYYEIFNRRMDQKIVEFRQRMKENAKEARKRARLMKKPQYSDPLYFGHKRKPKKRPVGKRKLCKECGIVH